MMRIAPTAGATSACRSTKPAARRCRRRWSPRCRRCGAAFEQRGIRCWASPGSEADDLAATLAVKVAQGGPSGHHRLHRQRLLPAAVAHHPHPRLLSEALAGRLLHRQRVRSVTPEQLADYGGLAGISSSKVPGVAGIGPKAPPSLLNEFQDLEGLYARLAEVPEKWRKSWPRIRRWPSPAGRSGPPADRPPAGRHLHAAAADALIFVKRCAGAG